MSTETAHIEKRKTLAPKLRFREFKEQWELKRLGDLSIVITKGTTPSYFSESGISFVKIEGLEGILINKEKCLFIDKTTHEGELKRSILEDGDILFAIAGATIGKVALVTSDILPANTNQALAIIRLRESKSRMLILQILQSWIMKKYIKLSIVTGAQPNLNLEQIGNFSFNCPPLPEQQKIASFLSAVDEKIQQLTRKKELLEQYKKGVMQQLFSGKLRFKDENDKAYPKWEEKELGEISSISTGSSNRQDSGLDGEFTFFDRSQDIRTSAIYLFDGEAIIVAGEGQEFIPKYFVGKFDLHQRTYAIMNYKDSIGKYLFYCIDFRRNYFFSQAVGSTVKSLRLPMFQKMKIKLPCIEEQQKIAGFLTALDAKIENVAIQIDHTQTFKKGLLQQMFV